MLKFTLVATLAALAAASSGRADFVPSNFDQTVKPQDDFYRYADGGWMKSNPIPPERSSWANYNILAEHNLEKLRVVCERATAENNEASAAEKMVGDFYSSGLDEEAIQASGTTPIKFEFERIATLKTSAAILKELAHLQSLGVDAGFGFSSGPDAKNSDLDIAQLTQGGLGLPDREYYTRQDANSKTIRDKYVAHVARMLVLLGEPPAAAQSGAQAVMKLETTLAEASLTPVALRDPVANYHKVSVDALMSDVPGIDWKAFFADMRAPAFSDLNLAQPDFFKALSKALAETPVADWQTYLRWHFIHEYSPYLNTTFVNENFDFYGKTLTGATELRPRWKRVVTTIDGTTSGTANQSLGEALGQLYTAAYFPPEAKVSALQLVENIKAALAERIRALDWMDDATKAKALEKLGALTIKIGYTDKWRDYSDLVIDRGPYVLNVLKTNAFDVRRILKKIGKPVDRGEWGMTPPTVNAYYRPSGNEIVFPAGILQKPFFEATADDPLNYGAIGAVIGHEMTHGFDDNGRQYDGHGNLSDWWTPECAAKFKEHAAGIVRQFNGYFVFPDLHVNGELTEGENIADLGGLKIAYAAMGKAMEGKSQDKIDGFTPEQRFFISFASVWAANYRPEALRLQVNTNPHSPNQFRVNGPLSNLDEFAQAFSVPDGAPMRRPPTDRVVIW